MDFNTLAILFMVVVIPTVIVFGYIAFHRWTDFKQAQMETASQEAAEKAAQYVAKTERLEQRVATLERILTDRSSGLADEIENLRDKPLN